MNASGGGAAAERLDAIGTGDPLHATSHGEVQAPAGLFSLFAALHYPNYRLFWVAQLFSVLGRTMEFATFHWLIYQLTNSPLGIAATGLAQAVPRIALVFVGGVIADRYDRRRLLLVTQGLSALLYFLLATLVILELVHPWHVWGVAFLLGCLQAFDGPSRAALLPHMVPREEMANAVALGNLAWELPRLVGPALAGVLMAVVGIGQTLYVAFLWFVIATVLFALVRAPQAVRSAERGLIRGILGGIDFIRRNDLFYTLIGMTFFNSVFGMSYQVLLPIFARDILEVGSQGFGFLQTGAAIGGTLGSLLVAALARSGYRGWQVIGGATLFGAILIAFGFSQSFALSAMLLFFAGLANNWYMTAIATTLQLRLPDEYRARVMGVYSITWSLQSVGGMISGGIAQYAGAPVALALGGSLVVSFALAVALLLPHVRHLE